MKRGLTVGLICLATGCGGDAVDYPSTNNSDEESDGTATNPGLEFRGSLNGDVAIDGVAQCQIAPSWTVMEWHVSGADAPAKLTISLSHPDEFPNSGEVLSATGSQHRVKLEGLHYTSQGSDRCDISVDEFVTVGQNTAIAVSLDGCELLHELFPNFEPTRVSGSLSCQANVARGNVCEPESYATFIDELARLTLVRTPNHDAIEAHIATLDCDTNTTAYYIKYLNLFENLISRFGHSIDSTELTTINMVAAIAPEVTDSDSYKAWLEAYELEFRTAVPSSSSLIDLHERAFLDQYHAIVPITTEGEAYIAWSALFGDVIDRSVPRPTLGLDEEEQAVIDELVSVMPVTESPDAYEAWFAIFERHFHSSAPTARSLIDKEEGTRFHYLRSAKPQSTSAASYLHWFPLFRMVLERSAPTASSVIDFDQQMVLTELVLARPPAGGDAAYIGWLDLYKSFLERAMGSSMPFTQQERITLQGPRRVLPRAVDGDAYLAWLDLFKTVLGRAGSSIDGGKEDALTDVLRNQPCGRSDRAAAAFDALVSEYTGEAQRFVQEADPSVCVL